MEKFVIWSILLLSEIGYIRCDYNFTYQMASRCKEHVCPGEYKYTTFYRVNVNDRKWLPGVAFETHLAILAPSNGHILLSSTERPRHDEPVYEFVVGAGGNTFTELRKKQGRQPKISSSTKDILSPIAFRSFFIRVMEDGLIEFSRENAPLAILSYHDVDPLPIKFFSFASWSGIQAKFLYDCPFYTDGRNPNSSMVEPYLTPRQKLHVAVINRGRGRPDGDMTTIYVKATIAGLIFDSDNCFLEATITLVMCWVDKAISWQPEMYNGTDNLSVRNNELWTPELVLYNSVGHGIIEPRESERIRVMSDGVATLSLRTRQQVRCAFSDDVQYRWPRDEYECNFLIGPWSMQDHLTVDLLTNDSVAKGFSAGTAAAISIEWDITYMSQSILTSQQRHSPHHGLSNSTSDEDQSTYKIHVSIKRKSYSYYLFLSIPFIVIVSMILLSFVLNPMSECRVGFYCCMIVTINLFIMYLDTRVPPYTVPLILRFYTVTVYSLITLLVIQIVLQQPCCRRFFYSRPMQAILTNKFLRTVFVLPPLKTCEKYDSMDDNVSRIGDSTSKESESDTAAMEDNSKEEAVLMIDRFVFGVYLAIYTTMVVNVY